MASSGTDNAGIPVDHSRQIPRLRRIKGQVRGVQQMVENGRPCIDVAHQIDAVIAALRRVQSDLVRDHMHAAVNALLIDDLPEVERRRLADEVGNIIARIV